MTRPGWRAAILVAALLASSVDARGDSAVQSVLVTTTTPRFGQAPDIVEAFGAATPSADGIQTLSLTEDGRVGKLLTSAGEAVQSGEPLLEWHQSAAARQSWKQACTALTLAQQQQKHAALLLSRHLATRDQLDQTDKAVADAQAIVTALRRGGADRPSRLLVSPFDGMVLTLPIAPGQQVTAGTPLASLAKAASIVVTVGVDPVRRPALRVGEAATVTPLAGGAAVAGMVLRFDSVLDPRTRLFLVDLSVPPGSVLPGVDYRAEITVGALQGWVVPHAAVQQDESGLFLFQAQGTKAMRVPVAVLGIRSGSAGDIDIVSGPVMPSHPIVLDGAYQLFDGAVLRQAATR